MACRREAGRFVGRSTCLVAHSGVDTEDTYCSTSPNPPGTRTRKKQASAIWSLGLCIGLLHTPETLSLQAPHTHLLGATVAVRSSKCSFSGAARRVRVAVF